MQESEYNKLDEIFKNGTDMYTPSNNEDAWQLVSDRLDKRDRLKKVMFWLWGIVLVMILGIVSYVSLDQEINEVDIAAELSEEDRSVDQDEEYPIEMSTELASQKTNESSESNLNVTTENIETIVRNREASVRNIVKENKYANLSEINNDVEYFAEARNLVSNKTFTTKINYTESMRKKEVSALSKLDNFKFKNIEVAHTDVNSLKVVPIIYQENAAQKDSRYFISGFVAPEWSSVGMFSEAKAGWKVGTSIGLPLSEHTELSIGVSLAKKLYKGSGSSYDMTGGWVDNVIPMNMESKCYIAEIPLSLTYYKNGRSENGLFVEGGLSSYFISSEWYGFNYSEAGEDILLRNGNEPVREVVQDNENKHLIGVGNFSIGYQYRLSSGTHIQMAPYIQIPFTGIGSGQVSLYSTGVKIGFKFSR